MEKTKIWVLYVIERQYDPAPVIILNWFNKRPTLDHLMQRFANNSEDSSLIIKVVNLWKIKETTIGKNEYHIEQISEQHIS